MRLPNLLLALALFTLPALGQTPPKPTAEELPAPPAAGITRPESAPSKVPPPPPEPMPPLPEVEDQRATVQPRTDLNAVPVPSNTPAVAEATSALYDNATELPKIFEAYKAKGYQPGVGHTMSASLLVNCLPGLTPEEKVAAMDALYRDVVARRIPVIVVTAQAIGFRQVEPQISLLAATLACKQGERTAAQTVDALEKAFAEIQAAPFNYTAFFHNLFVAANLMY